MAPQQHAPPRFPAAQVALLAIGALYLAWGIVGFFFLGDPTTDASGESTTHGGFDLETNALQNLAHIVVGLIALIGTANEKAIRVGAGVLLVAGLGMSAAGALGLIRPQADMVSPNVAVTIVHAMTALAALTIIVSPMPTPEDQASGPA